MRLVETAIAGVVIVEGEPHEDERGVFFSTYSRAPFDARGLGFTVAQAALSTNRRRGTVRGLHFQAAPHAEAKVVSCARGAIFDVAVDLRPGSPTHGRHVAVEVSADNHRALHVPVGCAHGFQTLEDDSVVAYLLSVEFVPAGARGVRWDDPTLAIPWPLPVSVISERDRALPPLGPSGR